jgi:M6 family metalloprotease-like protein
MMLNLFTGYWGANQFHKVGAPAFAFLVIFVLAISPALAQSGHQQGQTLPESAQAARVRALNNALLQLHGQMQGAAGAADDAIRGQAGIVIAERAAALQSLMEENPRAALSFAFAPELLIDLAEKFPDSSSLLESHGTWQGPLEVWVTDYAKPAHSKTTVLLKTGLQKFELHFAAGLPANLKSGDVAEAMGVVVGHDMAVWTSRSVRSGASLSPSTPTASSASVSATDFWGGRPQPILGLLLWVLVIAALGVVARLRKLRARILLSCKRCPVYATAFLLIVSNPAIGYAQSACSTTGVQNVAVLLVTFSDVTPPSEINTTSMNALFFGGTDPSLTRYWSEASYGLTSASGSVYGWFTLGPQSAYSCANITGLITDSLNAAIASGVSFSNFNRVAVIFPGMSPSCGWVGLSSIGCYSVSTSSGTLNLSTSTLVSTDMTNASQAVGIIAHEAGHQLGLAHARLREYGTIDQTTDSGSEILGPLNTTCTSGGSGGADCALFEYGDHFSVMGLPGAPNLGHYAAGHKAEQLGWLRSSVNYQTVTTGGTYTLEPYETSPAGLKALKVQRGTNDPGSYLWIEYRQPNGYYDSAVYPTQLYSGALIHYEDSITGLQTDLLDFTAPSTYSDDPALAAGQTWTDTYSNVSISVLSATASGLTVSVSYGATPCTSSVPSVSISPLDPSIYPGQSASYSATVTNNDSSGCSSSTINLGSSEPSGWTTSLSSSSVTLSPGQSASVTMGKGAPSGTPAGTYAVNLNAASTSSSASDTANATVMTPPTLAANTSVSGTSFIPPGSVPISVQVTNGGSPVSGASVTFTLTTPNGGRTTQSATTGSTGVTTWNYRLNSKSLVGAYSVTAQAALSSGSGGRKTNTPTQTATSNTASFTVQ